MKTLVLLEKRTSLIKLLQMFKSNKELEIREIKQKIPRATYYDILIKKLVDINSVLSKSKPAYFITPTFIRKNGKILSGLKIHPNISFEIKNEFVVLRYEEN